MAYEKLPKCNKFSSLKSILFIEHWYKIPFDAFNAHFLYSLSEYVVFPRSSKQTDGSVLGETEAAVSPCRAHGATEMRLLMSTNPD